jgi:hypothetical protein
MPLDEDFTDVVKSLRIQINNTVKTSHLMKHIVKRSLEPILDALVEMQHAVLSEVGRSVVEVLKEEVINKEPSGKTYLIIEFNPDVQKGVGGRYVNTGETYQASAPLEHPGSKTGTLERSLGFEITSKGVLKVGQVNLTAGGWSQGKTEFKSLFFRGNKIFVNDDLQSYQTPVGRYSHFLEEGTDKMAARPWISEVLKDMHEAIKQMIKDHLHEAIKRKTRSEGVRKAFTFRVFIMRK